jgi:lysophospholipase L1-like esterase
MRTSGQLLWRTVGLLSVLSFLLFAAGFVFALDPRQLASGPAAEPAEHAKPAPSKPGEGIRHVVALGDSLTRGAGDANGLGYVGHVRQALEKQTGHPVTLTNLAINGQESTGLVEQLSQPQVQKLLTQADLILFTIGGNDLFKQSGGVYRLDKEKLAAAAKGLTANYEQILRQIRELNASATIVYAALYNPFGDTEAAADTVKPVLDWNSAASAIAARYPRVIVVPTYDLFVNKEKTYLYTDHFHPNGAGYARIAERIMQALQ